MSVREFLDRVGQDPRLTLVYCDATMCIIRYVEGAEARDIRVGLWALSQCAWEQFLRAFRIPVDTTAA